METSLIVPLVIASGFAVSWPSASHAVQVQSKSMTAAPGCTREIVPGGKIIKYSCCNPELKVFTPETLRLVTYNIRKGGIYSLEHKKASTPAKSLETVMKVLSAVQFDVLALQEVDIANPRSGNKDIGLEFARRFHLCGVFVAGYDSRELPGDSTPANAWNKLANSTTGHALNRSSARQGVAVFSRYAIVEAGHLKLPPPTINAETAEAVTAHLVRNTKLTLPGKWGEAVIEKIKKWGEQNDSDRRFPEQRSLSRIALKTPEGKIQILDTHLSIPALDRLNEVYKIKEYVKSFGDDRIILVGDMNERYNGASLHILEAFQMKSANRLAGKPEMPTNIPEGFPESRPYAQIDHIFVRGAWGPVKHYENFNNLDDRELASDHYPVLFEIQVKPDPAPAPINLVPNLWPPKPSAPKTIDAKAK